MLMANFLWTTRRPASRVHNVSRVGGIWKPVSLPVEKQVRVLCLFVLN